jgi:hypothetical protein
VIWHPVKRLLVPLIILATLVLAGCSTVGPLQPASQNAAAAPARAETIGTGNLVIGVVSFSEPGNRSGGVHDASQKAVRLAADSMSPGTLTVLVQPETGNNSAALASQFGRAGSRIVVGGSDARNIGALSRALTSRQIPTITLAPATDTSVQLYSAALSPRAEARALVDEARRLGYRRIALVSGTEAESVGLAAAVAELALEQNISVQQIDGRDATSFATGLAASANAGAIDAIVFTADPQRADMLLQNGDGAGAQIVGNAGWALAEPLPPALRTSWYPSLPREGLNKFLARFRAAYGETPTLSAAILYDLVVLTAVLEQAVGAEAFSAASLQSDPGFFGFTGPFAFGAAGLVEGRRYEIVAGR